VFFENISCRGWRRGLLWGGIGEGWVPVIFEKTGCFGGSPETAYIVSTVVMGERGELRVQYMVVSLLMDR